MVQNVESNYLSTGASAAQSLQNSTSTRKDSNMITLEELLEELERLTEEKNTYHY